MKKARTGLLTAAQHLAHEVADDAVELATFEKQWFVSSEHLSDPSFTCGDASLVFWGGYYKCQCSIYPLRALK